MPGKRRKAKRGGGGGGKKNKDLDPDVQMETQEFDYIEVKRIVQNYVKTPILHLFFGRVPRQHWDRNVNYYYFVRRNNTPIGGLNLLIPELPSSGFLPLSLAPGPPRKSINLIELT